MSSGVPSSEARAFRSTAAIVGARLGNQRLTRPWTRGPASLVAWFGAVQAQEYGPARWGLGLRLPGVGIAAIDRALDRGRLLRTHVLRPTWHFVTARDVRWMLELSAPRIQRAMAVYRRQLGVDARLLTRAAAIFERALGDGACLTRAELAAHLARSGLRVTPTMLLHLTMYAELEGLIASGPRRGSKGTYALLATRAPRAIRLTRDEAIATLTRRYLQSHGPTTIRDLVWWSGLPTADARRGVAMVRARACAVDGLTYWTLGGGEGQGRRADGRALHLLPVYDEYLVAYRDRVAVPQSSATSFNAWHALLIGGQVAGTWRVEQRRGDLRVSVTARRRLAPDERRRLARVAARYGRFLGLPVTLTLHPS